MEDLEALLASEAGETAAEAGEVPAGTGSGDAAEPADADADASRAASATLGPSVDEPVNRPLYDEITAQLGDAVGEEEEDALDAEDDEHARG
jgi:hypothetical protein